MKLIYVKIPVVTDYLRAYVVSQDNSEEDLLKQLEKDKAVFEKEAVWFQKPEKTSDGKGLKFHQMSDDWEDDSRH